MPRNDHKWVSSVLLLPSDPLYNKLCPTKSGLSIVERLEEVGFDVHLIDSNYRNKFVITILSLSSFVIQRKAEEMRLPTPADSSPLRDILSNFNDDFLLSGDNMSLDLVESIFLPYSISLDEDKLCLYQRSGISGGIGTLQEPLRQVVVDELLENTFHMSNLIKSGLVIDCFLPHDEKRQLQLWRYLIASYPGWTCSGRPIHLTPQLCGLRDYVGKHTALYCVFIMVISYYHLPATAAGIVLACIPREESSLPAGAALLGLIVPLLGFLSLRLWRRHEARVACDWNSFSRDSLELGLPMSHSYFTQAHLVKKDKDSALVTFDEDDLPAPASTLPLIYTRQAWWFEKQHDLGRVLGTRFGTARTGERVPTWPTSPCIRLMSPTLAMFTLRSMASIICSVVSLPVACLISVTVYILVRSVLVFFAGSAVENQAIVLDFALALHVLFVLSIREAIDTTAITLTNNISIRTAYAYHAALLWRRTLLELACWLGPSVYSLALRRHFDGTRACFFHDRCSKTLGHCALFIVIGHIIGEILSNYLWPFILNLRRRNVLKMSDLTLQRLNKSHYFFDRTSATASINSNGNSFSESQSDRANEAWCNPLLGSPRTTHESKINNEELSERMNSTINLSSGIRDVAMVAEKEFLTLMKSAIPDRDADACSVLAPHYAVTVGFVLRWTFVWIYFAVAPSIALWCTLYQGVELLLAAHKEIFLRRRSLSPATQYLGIDTAAIDLLTRIAMLSFVIVASFICFYSDVGQGGILISALAINTNSSTVEMVRAQHYFFLVLLFVGAVLHLAICEFLPCVPDSVIITSLRNEYVWRRLKTGGFPIAESSLRYLTHENMNDMNREKCKRGVESVSLHRLGGVSPMARELPGDGERAVLPRLLPHVGDEVRFPLRSQRGTSLVSQSMQDFNMQSMHIPDCISDDTAEDFDDKAVKKSENPKFDESSPQGPSEP